MRPLIPILLFAVPATLAAQKPSDWRKSNEKPQVFAKKVDSGLFNIKNALGEAGYNCRYFDGGKGQAILVNRIRDRKTFRVEFVKTAEGTDNPLSFQTLIAKNGKAHLLWGNAGFRPLAPGKDPGLMPASSSFVDLWPRHFQQAMFQSYITGVGSFSRLVAGLAKPGSGFNVRVETRTMSGSGKSIPQMRIYAARTAAAQKKLGKASIEIVADRLMWLPLHIRVDQTNVKGKSAYFEWVSRWNGPKKFEESYFTVPPKKGGA